MTVLNREFARFWFRSPFSLRARRRLWLKLSKLLTCGVPILKALESLHARRAKLKQDDVTTIALDMLKNGVQNGERLATLLDGWVPDGERMLIAAGEDAGDTEGALLRAADTIQAIHKIVWTVIKKTFYPIVLMCMAFGLLYTFGFKIVPGFTRIIAEDRFHGIARAMIEVSRFMENYLVVVFVVWFGSIAAFIWSLPRWDGSARVFLDRYAPYNIYRIVQGSTWLISFAAMIGAGMRIETALEQLMATANPWLHKRISSALSGMRSGRNLGDALEGAGYGFPDPEIIDDLGVYAPLPKFEEQLQRMGEEWMTEGVEEIEMRMAVIAILTTLFVGGLLAFMVSGLMSMQLQMAGALQSTYR